MSNNSEASPRQDARVDQAHQGQQLHAMNGAMGHIPPQYSQVNQIPLMVTHYPNGSSSNMQQIRYQQPMGAQPQFFQPQVQQQQQQQQHQQQHQLQVQQSQTPQLPQGNSQQLAQPSHQQQQPPPPPPPPPQQQVQAPPPQPQPQPLQHPQPNHQMQMMGATLSQQGQVPPPHHFQTPTRSGMIEVPMPVPVHLRGSKHGTPLGTPESQRKRQRKADHAFPGEDGDLELKNMAAKVLDIPLDEFAAKVRAIEASNVSDTIPAPPINNGRSLLIKNDATKERQRQVFGMTWLMRACQASSSAVVPRNRIYARYVGICAENALKPLSPASFGKLVRIVFPTLTTRRLGMRGQSKYHYCGLKLINDDSASAVGSSANTPLHSHSQNFDSSFLPGSPYGSNSPASFHSQVSTPMMSNPTSASTNVTTITSFLNDQIAPELKFVSDLSSVINYKGSGADHQFDLPDIKPFLPEGTDIDAADTLEGLYKSHCSAIFESIRYVQLKRLYGLISSFHGSLTAPVLKVYTSPNVFSWVIACDSIMFKSLIKMLAKLALQDIPSLVLEQLKELIQKFTDKLSESLGTMPKKLSISKLKLAKQFCQLVSRFVRVVETAQSANKILSHHMDREVMYNDWTKHVNVEQIAARELPCDGDNYKSAVEVLQTKIPEMLKKDTTVYDSFIVEWGTYIASLPATFDNVPPRLFLLCTSALLTSALREISLAGGGGFGAWWVVRCWVDEWVGWCAELGGFISSPLEEGTLLPSTGDVHRPFVKPIVMNAIIEDGKNKHDLTTDTIDLLDGQFGGMLPTSGEEKK